MRRFQSCRTISFIQVLEWHKKATQLTSESGNWILRSPTTKAGGNSSLSLLPETFVKFAVELVLWLTGLEELATDCGPLLCRLLPMTLIRLKKRLVLLLSLGAAFSWFDGAGWEAWVLWLGGGGKSSGLGDSGDLSWPEIWEELKARVPSVGLRVMIGAIPLEVGGAGL